MASWRGATAVGDVAGLRQESRAATRCGGGPRSPSGSGEAGAVRNGSRVTVARGRGAGSGQRGVMQESAHERTRGAVSAATVTSVVRGRGEGGGPHGGFVGDWAAGRGEEDGDDGVGDGEADRRGGVVEAAFGATVTWSSGFGGVGWRGGLGRGATGIDPDPDRIGRGRVATSGEGEVGRRAD
nr:spidroin-1-like [Aegilops tauschii subsp. strangulata]